MKWEIVTTWECRWECVCRSGKHQQARTSVARRNELQASWCLADGLIGWDRLQAPRCDSAFTKSSSCSVTAAASYKSPLIFAFTLGWRHCRVGRRIADRPNTASVAVASRQAPCSLPPIPLRRCAIRKARSTGRPQYSGLIHGQVCVRDVSCGNAHILRALNNCREATLVYCTTPKTKSK